MVKYNMILFDNVSVAYDNDRLKTAIVKNLTFKLPSRGLIALEGKSGSGKSTIFNLISHEILKTSGKIKVAGYDYDTITNKDIDIIRKNIVGYIYQDNQLFNHLKVIDNIKVILNVSGILFKNCVENFEKYSNLLKINDLMELEVSKLSGGEKERVAILITILRNTKIVLADEPTASLDLENATIVVDTLKELSKDRLVLVSTHDIELIEKYTDQYIKLSYGEILELNVSYFESSYEAIKKTKTLNTLKISHQMFSKQLVRKVVFTIVLMISMCFVVVGLYNVMFDMNNLEFKSYKSFCDYYVVSNESAIEYNTFDITSEKANKFKKYTKFYYDLDLITYADLVEGDSESSSCIQNYIINNDLKDNDIIITDYSKERCDELHLKSFVIDNEIALNIVKVRTTNYHYFDKLTGDSKYNFVSYIDNWYKNIELNENTFNTLRHRKKKTFTHNGEEYRFYKKSLVNPYNIEKGKMLENDNEIMFSSWALCRYLGVDRVDDESEYIGKKISLELAGKMYDFTLSGIFVKAGLSCPEVAFTDSFCNTIVEYEDRVVDIPHIAVRPGNTKEYKKIKKLVKEEKLKLLNPLDDEVSEVIEERKAARKISIYILVAGLILEISMLYYMNFSIFKNNLRTFGILKHNGISNRDILGLVFYDSIPINISTSIIAVVAYVCYVALNRNAIEYNYVFNANILNFNLWIVCIFVLFTILIHMILLYFNMVKLKNKENKDLLTSY